MLKIRSTRLKILTNSDPRPKGTATNDNAFSPKFGLVISKRKSIRICNIYQFFAANTGYDINRDALKPTTIDQYEVGIKEFVEQCHCSQFFCISDIIQKLLSDG
jgi:iron complex outermembrane receptor protein